MSDLRTMLHEAAGPGGTTAVQFVDADLARARLALRRRRLTRAGGGTALVAAVALGASAVLNPALLPGSTSTPVTATAPEKEIRLVAYHGDQAVGFTLDEVPAGWRVDRVDTDVLALIPENAPRAATPTADLTRIQKQKLAAKKRQDAQDPEPAGAAPPVSGGRAPESAGSEGSVVVMLTAAGSVAAKAGTAVTVQGRPGTIVSMLGENGEEDGTRSLFLRQPGGDYLTVQVGSGLRWSDDDTVRLADGIHVTADAAVGVG